MSLHSLFSLGRVRHVHFCNHMEVAFSAYPHCHEPPTCPCNLCWCFYSLILPCTAGWSLPSKDLCGSFLSSQPCLQHRRDFCGLPSAPWACHLCCRVCVHLFWLTGPSYVLELVSIWFGSLGSPSMLQSLCVLLSSPWTCSLTTRVMCAAEIFMPYPTRHPGPPSAPRDFSGLPLIPWACYLVGAIVCELFMVWGVQLSLFCAL